MSDEFLKGRLAQYHEWLMTGKIPHSAKVIPVREAFAPEQWVIPTQQALELIRNARSFALRDCVCRTHYGRCDNPRHVCLSINDVSDQFVAAGEAHRITLAEAGQALKVANQAGLVHLSVYNPQQYVWGLCSCCTCCCYQLQLLLKHGRRDLVVHSDYIAAVDEALCDGCGACLERCHFGARARDEGGRVAFVAENCWGCGLCVTTCPQGAVRLERRGRPLPYIDSGAPVG